MSPLVAWEKRDRQLQVERITDRLIAARVAERLLNGKREPELKTDTGLDAYRRAAARWPARYVFKP